MRNAVRYLLVAGALMAPQVSHAIAGIAGAIALEDCSTYIDATDYATYGAELYITKITPVAADIPNDLLFDLRAKGGGQTGGTTGTQLKADASWETPDAWKFTQNSTDVHFIVVTMKPTGPGQGGRIFVDSGSISGSGTFFEGGAIREVGSALPTGQGASNGLQLPGDSSTYTAGGKTWPVGTNTLGINVVFSPIPDVNNAEGVLGSFCRIGGAEPNPRDTAAVDTMGGIIGYNVWRIPGTAGTVPTAQDFLTAYTDGPANANGPGFVYFINLAGFNLRQADVNTGSAGTVSPVEASAATATDLAGLQNPNGIAYDGDEFLIFQDSTGNSGTPRAAGTAPDVTLNYWYAFQPVLIGNVADFNQETLTFVSPPLTRTVAFTNNGTYGDMGDHRSDLNGNGIMDAVNLDYLGSVEFISPQADSATPMPGLGLTNGGLPLMSAPIFYNGRPVAQLPAFGQVALTGGISGNQVDITFSTGLEKGTVLGYNVYRVAGEQRVRVNEQPILAKGTESNVYQVVDGAVRGRGQRAVTYMVEIVYSDGTAPTMVGPFSVSLDQQPVRRRR